MEQMLNGRNKQLAEIEQRRAEKLRRHRDALVEGQLIAPEADIESVDVRVLNFQFGQKLKDSDRKKERLEKQRNIANTEITQLKQQILMLSERITEQKRTVQRHAAEIGSYIEELMAALRPAQQTSQQPLQGEDEESLKLESSLGDVQRQLQQLRDERGEAFGRQYLYKRYVRERDQHSACPLCTRDFTDNESRPRMIARLEQELASVPEQLRAKDADIELIDKRRTKLLQILPKEVDNIKRDVGLKQNEQALLQARYEDPLKKNADMQTEYEECSKFLKLLRSVADMSVLSSEEERLNKLREDIFDQQNKLDDKLNIIQALISREDISASQLSATQIMPSYESKEELKRLREEENVINDEVEELEKQMSEKGAQLRVMQSDLSKAQNKLIALQDKLKAQEQRI